MTTNRGAALAHNYQRRPATPRAHITKRQREALTHAAAGHPNDAIGRRMGITTNTVNSLLQLAYRKLGAGDRTVAVVIALKRGLIHLEDIDLPISEGNH